MLCRMICAMKRTNFYFPEQMLLRLKSLSNAKGVTVSELIRVAVEKFLKSEGV